MMVRCQSRKKVQLTLTASNIHAISPSFSGELITAISHDKWRDCFITFSSNTCLDRSSSNLTSMFCGRKVDGSRSSYSMEVNHWSGIQSSYNKGSKSTSYFTRKSYLWVIWFKVKKNRTSVSLTSAPGMGGALRVSQCKPHLQFTHWKPGYLNDDGEVDL